MTTEASNIDVNLLQVGRLEDSSSVSSQRVARVNYETSNKKLHIQTPAFITETYGIPREGPYYQNDKQRAFYKLPFCHGRSLYADQIDYVGIEKFYNKMLELDKYFGSEEMKLQLLVDKLSSKYEYQSLVRPPDIEDEITDEYGNINQIADRPPYPKINPPLLNK